ncbi:MAG: hypothetical protein JWM11_4463, partial [Planctomycetaceae bacterium]|nr:hypothetical protein [Planctomycetaceae bacterium]
FGPVVFSASGIIGSLNSSFVCLIPLKLRKDSTKFVFLIDRFDALDFT